MIYRLPPGLSPWTIAYRPPFLVRFGPTTALVKPFAHWIVIKLDVGIYCESLN